MIGSTISHYRIVEKLGEGGMGVVYKAEDTKLRRTVALKFLAREALDDEDVAARLVREAQAAAALDHPNICAVHEIDEENGQTFIAMAYVDGPSLAQKIRARPLPLDEALEIAMQVACGLQEAHEHGVVHRDVKPHNIALTSKGQAKVMDFGLASLAGRSKLTKSGTTLGTPSYMAPEQLEGKDVDRRADVWALGCVFYEMLTQKTPFDAEYEQAIAYGILNEDPEPVTALRSGLPMELDRILSKALAKDPSERYQHVDDLLTDLRVLQKQTDKTTSSGRRSTTTTSAGATPIAAEGSSVVVSKTLLRSLYASLFLAAAIATVATYAYVTRTAEPPRASTVRFSIPAPALAPLATGVISPDGQYIVFVEHRDGVQGLWLRPMEGEELRYLEGTQGAIGAFWSPDNSTIAFGADGQLRRVGIAGATPITICSLPSSSFPLLGGSWSPDGDRIAFASGSQIYRVPAGGGDAELMFGGLHPLYLPVPDRDVIVYTAVGGRRRLTVFDSDTGQHRELVPGSWPAYSEAGYLVYGYMFTPGLFAAPFSLDTLETNGEPFRISEEGFQPSISSDGTLVYKDPPPEIQQFAWRNRSGELIEYVGEPQMDMTFPDLSPNGLSAAVGSSESGSEDIWIHDLVGSTKRRFTFDVSAEQQPRWDGSGASISYRRSPNAILQTKTLAGVEGVLTETAMSAFDLSLDGRFLVARRRDGPLVYLDLGDDAASRELIEFDTLSRGGVAEFSPDGRFLAYASNESGSFEIYVRPFPSGEGKWQISTGGGTQPRWRRDGREIYFVQRDVLIGAPVSMGAGVSVGAPARLFQSQDLFRADSIQNYDVAADGQRFLTIAPSPTIGDQVTQIRVVQNWYEEFRDRRD